MKYFICLAFVFCFCLPSNGQQIKVHGGFLTDSVGIGEQTRYYLVVKYPSKLNILFPDSTFDFKPFEFEKKQYFPTKTTDSLSYDSAIYYLSTFEVDAIQHLSLSVFVVNKNDSVIVTANGDSIKLSQLVKHLPDSISVDKLPLKMTTAYQEVSYLFNYPVLIIIACALLILALIIVFGFGKRIKKYFRVKRLKKNHQKFLESYTTYLEQLKTTFSSSMTEYTLATWKTYMEQLEPKPYAKLTTREIVLLENDKTLGETLHQIDRSIYGHGTGATEPLEKLRDYASQKFFRKLEAVKHGK